MGGAEDFEKEGLREERFGAATWEGVDRRDSSPVLIYEFDGDPLLPAGGLDSPSIPRIVWSDTTDGRATMVAALPRPCRTASERGLALGPARLADAARALRDAERAGIVHGDIRAERLLLCGARLLVEGYGVPWTALARQADSARQDSGDSEADGAQPPDPREDVRALAAAARAAGVVREATLDALLDQCEDPDPSARPSAEELHLALTHLAAETSRPRPAPPPQVDRRHDHERGSPEPRDSGAGDRQADARRRLALLGILLAAVILLALLAVTGPRGGRMPPPREAVVYVVEVRVEPEDLPPVTLHLIASPAGSSLERGTLLGTAPRHLALDRAGVWAFQGSFQDRRSEIVEIRVPEERSFTLAIPE